MFSYILSIYYIFKYILTKCYWNILQPIENYFNQIKTYIKKNRSVYTFEGLAKNIDTAITKVKSENYKNYFQYAYGAKDDTYKRKPSTSKRKLKIYKP